MDHPFAGLVIKSVLACYAVWGAVLIGDLALCESKRPGTCDAQRTELRAVATAVPGTLLAWLADSPISGKSRTVTRPARVTKPTTEEKS